MLVKNWMNKPAITIDKTQLHAGSVNLMKTHRISMLPVMDNKRLVGVVTDRDLKKASPSEATTLEIHELLYLLSTIQSKISCRQSRFRFRRISRLKKPRNIAG